MDFGNILELLKNLTTKIFFCTKKIYQEITIRVSNSVSEKSHLQKFKYLYIINRIIADKAFHKGIYYGCKLNIKNLTALFGNKHSQTSAIIKHLTEWGIIHKTKDAAVGNASARYAFTAKYSEDRLQMLQVDITEASFVRKLIDYDKVENDKILFQLSINIHKLSINNDGILYLTNKYNIHTIDGVLNQKTSHKVSRTYILQDEKNVFLLGGVEFDMVDLPLIQIYLKDFNTSRPDQKSRVYNNLTNLKREFRKYISFNGKPLLMTDISNCQVLLSAAAVKKQYSITSGIGKAGLYEDVKSYQQLAESGLFYEYLIEKSGYVGDRGKFKKDFFSQVFFSKVVNYSMPIKDAFVKEFPNVYLIINQLKLNDYRDFAIGMQRMESSIMIDNVAKKMVKEGRCILTLHDAIVCDNLGDLERAELLISNAMDKLDISPNFKREMLQIDDVTRNQEVFSQYEGYDEETDTAILVLNNRTYYFGNNSIISSALSDPIEIRFLRKKLIASTNGAVNYKGKVFKFCRCEDGDEEMILLVA
ncbi:hypothetical protein D3C87_105720 [compost metagenome]